mgnify:CR=1 FL=1
MTIAEFVKQYNLTIPDYGSLQFHFKKGNLLYITVIATIKNKSKNNLEIKKST